MQNISLAQLVGQDCAVLFNGIIALSCEFRMFDSTYVWYHCVVFCEKLNGC